MKLDIIISNFKLHKNCDISMNNSEGWNLDIESPCIILLPNISKMINLSVANKAMK